VSKIDLGKYKTQNNEYSSKKRNLKKMIMFIAGDYSEQTKSVCTSSSSQYYT